jgi:uncharacterized protein
VRLNEVVFNDAKPVEGYGPGFFRIGGQVIEGAVIAAPSGTRTWGGLEDLDALMALVAESDVIFIGTGAEIAHLPGGLRAQLEEAGVGIEAMSSPAAARTYNVLLSEGRRVALALLPI